MPIIRNQASKNPMSINNNNNNMVTHEALNSLISPKPSTPLYRLPSLLQSPHIKNKTPSTHNISYPYFQVPERDSASSFIQSPRAYSPILAYPYNYLPETNWFKQGIEAATMRGQSDDDDQEINEDGKDYEDIIKGIMELYGKLPEKAREKVIMEIVKNETNEKSSLNIGYSGFKNVYTTPTRGLLRGPVDQEMKYKLERFKIRTVLLGGIDRGDHEDNTSNN